MKEFNIVWMCNNYVVYCTEKYSDEVMGAFKSEKEARKFIKKIGSQ